MHSTVQACTLFTSWPTSFLVQKRCHTFKRLLRYLIDYPPWTVENIYLIRLHQTSFSDFKKRCPWWCHLGDSSGRRGIVPCKQNEAHTTWRSCTVIATRSALKRVESIGQGKKALENYMGCNPERMWRIMFFQGTPEAFSLSSSLNCHKIADWLDRCKNTYLLCLR